jgi:hypothetical protein
MDSLEQTYVEKRRRYDQLISQNDPRKMDDIKTLNKDIAKILQSMLVELSKVKEDARKIDTYRNDLIVKLISIQNDHNAMVTKKDHEITLKELNRNETVAFNANFFWYAVFLTIVTIAFVAVLMWKGGYKAPIIPTAISNPATMAPFTYA